MFDTIDHHVDLAVIGGGLAGLCAAVAAARHGLKVALMQERPMLGGNASSEIRMWVCGARGRDMRETGLLEEIMLENQYRNAEKNYSVWDAILYGVARAEENIVLLLNCTCMACDVVQGRIRSATGWQMTTQYYHRVHAAYFADCSGDSVLAALAGAEYRMGREGHAEFGERIAPAQPDCHTMGMSCLLTARESNRESVFVPPPWAKRLTQAELHLRMPKPERPGENFWYLELGGMGDTIADTERVRDELLALAYGLWDYVKNAPENKEKYACWQLEWVGILPGKRESRRCLGDYVMKEQDVLAGGPFEDIVAYGGWTMDDHDPAGFYGKGAPNIHHSAPSPFGIPYRCLYSRNIENLFFAGRNISVSHAALSSTRVMGTCALLGQAVGTAAAVAARKGCMPRQAGERWIGEIQRLLMEDDCYLPGLTRCVPTLTRKATLTPAAAEPLRDGIDRPIGQKDHGFTVDVGRTVAYHFAAPARVRVIRLVFDSDLNRDTLPAFEGDLHRNMPACRMLNWGPSCVPKTLVRAFRLEGMDAQDNWTTLLEEGENYQRLRVIHVDATLLAVRLTPLATWGTARAHLFAFDVSDEEAE